MLANSEDVSFESSLRETYPRFQLLRDPQNKIRTLLAQAATGSGTTYLIDPLGNIMMAYEGGADPNHIKQDLKRLLTWSKLDEQ